MIEVVSYDELAMKVGQAYQVIALLAAKEPFSDDELRDLLDYFAEGECSFRQHLHRRRSSHREGGE